MAKDPAFLFYSGDFLTGTMFMTNEQVGKYIRLLCAIHQHGHLMRSQVDSICGGNTDECILAKFSQDENGHFFHEKLENEIERRKQHSEKQKENAFKRWHKFGNATALPLETETETETETEVENKTETINQRRENFLKKVHEQTEFPEQMRQKFFEYWSESNENGRKMRFEMQKVFDIKRRLNTWKTNEFKFKNNNNAKNQSTSIIQRKDFGSDGRL